MTGGPSCGRAAVGLTAAEERAVGDGQGMSSPTSEDSEVDVVVEVPSGTGQATWAGRSEMSGRKQGVAR